MSDARDRQAEEEGAQASSPEVVAGAYRQALAALQDRTFCGSTRYQSQQWRAVREGAHPDILEFERRFVRRFHKLGVPVFAHCVWRTKAEQDRLFVTGNSKAGFGHSPHNWGCAVDLVHGVKAWNLSRAQWDLFGHVGHEVALALGIEVEWGGKWAFYDPAHWELKHWRAIRASKGGS